jgi:hypothetical protein
MKSYEVVETLRESRKAVFTPKDIPSKPPPHLMTLS